MRYQRCPHLNALVLEYRQRIHLRGDIFIRVEMHGLWDLDVVRREMIIRSLKAAENAETSPANVDSIPPPGSFGLTGSGVLWARGDIGVIRPRLPGPKIGIGGFCESLISKGANSINDARSTMWSECMCV